MSAVRIHILRPSGVDIWLEGSSLDIADAQIKHLWATGYRPVSTGASEWLKGPDGSPLGPTHNVVMQKRER
jgi:hypothetical protein